MRKTIILMLIAIVAISKSYTQDSIYTVVEDTIVAWVVEQNDQTVRYQIMNTSDSPCIEIKSNYVDSIVFRDGQVIRVRPDVVRMDRRFGISVGGMVTLIYPSVLLIFQSDYFITPALNASIQIIMFPGEEESIVFGGANYYFDSRSKRKWKGYAGLMLGAGGREYYGQIPLGVQYVGERGFEFRTGVRTLVDFEFIDFSSFAELAFGYRF